MKPNYSLKELRAKYRTDFVDYFSYLGIAHSLEEDPTPITALSPTSDYESVRALEDTLRSSLHNRKDRREIMGLAASQIGIPVHATYLEYNNTSGDPTNVLLINPNIEPQLTDGKPPQLFIKLVKCPNSPSPYHIGLFNKQIIIKSSNHKGFTLSAGGRGDLDGSISANLQRIIWADKGFIPGDMEQIPMNYFKVADTLESSEKLKSAFHCYIHRDEINLIISKYRIVDAMGQHSKGTKYLHTNLINILCNNLEEEWIRLPNVNLFRELGNKMLVT